MAELSALRESVPGDIPRSVVWCEILPGRSRSIQQLASLSIAPAQRAFMIAEAGARHEEEDEAEGEGNRGARGEGGG